MDGLVCIKVFDNRFDAEYMKSILEAHEIEAFVSADDCGSWRPHLAFTEGVKLIVNEKDVVRAMEIFEPNSQQNNAEQPNDPNE